MGGAENVLDFAYSRITIIRSLGRFEKGCAAMVRLLGWIQVVVGLSSGVTKLINALCVLFP